VTVSRGQIVLTHPGKAGKLQEQAVAEDQVCAVIRSLKRRRGGDRLLAYRSGRCWHDVAAADINDYLREVAGGEFTAKDFPHLACHRPGRPGRVRGRRHGSRAQLIQLTPAGRAASDRIREAGASGMQAALAHWPPQELY
jgi:DNA topoisomerase IB